MAFLDIVPEHRCDIRGVVKDSICLVLSGTAATQFRGSDEEVCQAGEGWVMAVVVCITLTLNWAKEEIDSEISIEGRPGSSEYGEPNQGSSL
jgi:hypothetical protein